MIKKIFVIVSHGKNEWFVNDDGATNGSITERALSKKICNQIKKSCDNDKFIFIGENRMRLSSKINAVNSYCNNNGLNRNNSILVSVHINSFEDSGASGTEAWFKGGDSKAQELAKVIDSNIRKTTGLSKHGTYNLKPDTSNRHGSLGIVRTSPLGVLLEVGFISNNDDLKIINSKDGQRHIAEGIIYGLEEYTKTKLLNPAIRCFKDIWEISSQNQAAKCHSSKFKRIQALASEAANYLRK